jgi:hypothetical protein
MFFALVSWPSAPVAYSLNRPKSQIFNVGLCSMDQKLHGDDEETRESDFETFPNVPQP